MAIGLALPKRIYAGLVPNSQTLAYTVPANIRTIVTSMTVVNRTAQQRQVYLWIVPNGESETDDQWAYLYDFDIGGNELVQMTSLSEVLEEGAEIWIEASLPNVFNLRVNGTETEVA